MAQPSKPINWQKHIQHWQVSGLSQAAYCQMHGLSTPGFYYWRKRLATGVTLAPTIIPVVRETPSAGVQLRSPGGWLVALPAAISDESLRCIVAALP